MGLIQHHAVIATTCMKDKATSARSWIDALPAADSALFAEVPAELNRYTTFVLTPDGSKENWPESDHGDDLRAKFIARLAEDAYSDGSTPWEYVEVEYGELGASVVSTNTKNRY